MRLQRLRHQLLIAMGVPACWTQGAPEPAAPPPARPAVRTGFDLMACARDTIHETVCGVREEDLGRCGPRGDSLASYDEVKLYLTEETDEPRTYRRFELDARATTAYRETLEADGLAVNEHCCYSRCTPLGVGRADQASTQARFGLEHRCLPKPPRGTTVPAAEDPACPAAVRFDGTLRAYAMTEDESCCYMVPSRRIAPVKGRPARVDGEARFAEVGVAAEPAGRGASLDARAGAGVAPGSHAGAAGPVTSGAGAGWRAPEALRPEVDALPRALRDRLAAAWLEAAREEHASIASFANLSLRLLALGAPPDLVADAHAAALDEIRHARRAFELASAYAGATLAPAAFPDAARMSAAGGLAALAIETLLDGCINETVAAALAGTAGESAADPAVAAVLAEVAGDEARHAELAWRIVAWCVRSGGAGLHAALRETAAAAARAPLAASPDPRDDLAAHGVLGDAAHAATRAGVLREIVAPCLDALAA